MATRAKLNQSVQTSPSFRDLQKEWDEKLKQSGFQDIETRGKGSTDIYLKHWDSYYFGAASHGFRGHDAFCLKTDYYLRAMQFAQRGDFSSAIEREMWALHAEGLGVREIARRLNERMDVVLNGENYTRDKVWRTLKTLKNNMEQFFVNEKRNLDRDQVVMIRDATNNDLPYVFSTWLNNLYANCRWRYAIEKPKFNKYNTVLEHIIRKPSTQIKVAALREDSDVIVGYSVFEKNPMDTILHWVFVRADWQGNGLARDLMPKPITIVTHMTKVGERIWQKMTPKPKKIILPLSYEILEISL